MNTKILELLKLIEENPTLEIMPMVNTECVGGDNLVFVKHYNIKNFVK